MKITATSDTKPQTATSGLQWDEIRYVYDALGRRLAKIVTENGNFKRATRFIYDGWNVVEERTERQGAAGISKFLFWGEDLSGSFQGAGGVGGLVAHMEKPDSAGWTAYYYHPDANGNIAAVTSPFRALAAKFSYDAFGRTTSQSGPKSGIDIHAVTHRFSTKPMELELATSNSTLVPPPVSSGLYYYGYRFYSPNLGRWISRDPIREQGGRNLYNFVGNDGVDYFDVLGEHAFSLWNHWQAGSGTPVYLPFSTLDKGWKVSDFPEYSTFLALFCKKRVPFIFVNTTINYDFGGTSIGVGNPRLMGVFTFGEKENSFKFSGNISIDDNFYDFNKGSRPWKSEFLTGVGRYSSPIGKDYWVIIQGSRKIKEDGCCEK